ncbi:hypothetical protein R4B61_04465 [Fructilactobacillus vespulae]|uniref:hypothetical protein n=1 Tax=Fructilactobacillus vespulae TaxID=1249630 RepID=UPI0039B3EBA3
MEIKKLWRATIYLKNIDNSNKNISKKQKRKAQKNRIIRKNDISKIYDYFKEKHLPKTLVLSSDEIINQVSFTVNQKEKSFLKKAAKETQVFDFYTIRMSDNEVKEKTQKVAEIIEELKAVKQKKKDEKLEMDKQNNDNDEKEKVIIYSRQNKQPVNEEKHFSDLLKSFWFWVVGIPVFLFVFQINIFKLPPISWFFLPESGDFNPNISKFLRSIMFGMNIQIFVGVLVALWFLNSEYNPLRKYSEILVLNKYITIVLCLWVIPYLLYNIVFILVLAFGFGLFAFIDSLPSGYDRGGGGWFF